MARPRENVDDRFWRFVQKTSGCWNWTGSNIRGYGRFMLAGRKMHFTHRWSYERFVGKIPSGLIVCHKCDNPSCVNPEHLFVGTHKDNAQDRNSKGRNADVSGEKNAAAKLSKNDVLEIRNLYFSNDVSNPYLRKKYSQYKLAKAYGVSQSAISMILSEKRWEMEKDV